MGTTFVGIDRTGFWMTDSVLELWLRLAALHIEDPTSDSSLASKVRDQWLLASRGYFQGHVPHGIGDLISTEEGRSLMTQAVVGFRAKLMAAPELLDFHVLNLLGFDQSFGRSIERWRLIEVCDAITALMEKKISYDVSSTAFMPGCGKEPIQSITDQRASRVADC